MRLAKVSLATLVIASLHLASLAADAIPAEDPASSATNRQPLSDPTFLLIRDDSVRAELNLSDDQRRAIDDVLKKSNRVLLAIRDVSSGGAGDTVRPAVTELHDQFAKILSAEQLTRLSNLVLQAQGYDAILRNDVSAKLALTDQQQRELESTAEKFRTAAEELSKSSTGGTPERLQQKLAALQKNRQQQILKILTEQQTAQYGALLGAPFDFSKAKSSPANAPEFEGIEAWINSDPITMESLRGKVVIIHFFAFGCINCIHNYPWYKDWHDRLSDKGVVIIGIHTPETETERDNALLEESLATHGLAFPVAVDKQSKMWQEWNNGIWPSVYIIDKHGRLRYWWYGELDWQGAGNQRVAERQIEQLLAEE